MSTRAYTIFFAWGFFWGGGEAKRIQSHAIFPHLQGKNESPKVLHSKVVPHG